MSWLGALPLIVLRHGKPNPVDPGLPPELGQQMEQVWQELQAELAAQSSNGKLIVAEQSGHYIQLDQPELVIETVEQVVELARK